MWDETVTFGHFALDLMLVIFLNSFWFAGFNEWRLVQVYSELNQKVLVLSEMTLLLCPLP